MSLVTVVFVDIEKCESGILVSKKNFGGVNRRKFCTWITRKVQVENRSLLILTYSFLSAENFATESTFSVSLKYSTTIKVSKRCLLYALLLSVQCWKLRPAQVSDKLLVPGFKLLTRSDLLVLLEAQLYLDSGKPKLWDVRTANSDVHREHHGQLVESILYAYFRCKMHSWCKMNEQNMSRFFN